VNFARHTNLFAAACGNVAYGLTGALVAACGLVVALALLLSGIALNEGQRRDSLAGVAAGPAVRCTWLSFGHEAPLADTQLSALAALPGVVRCVPLIVGRIELGGRPIEVRGVPWSELARESGATRGARVENESEVLLGVEVARALDLGVGSTLALDARLLRLFTVAGLVEDVGTFVSRKAVVCELEEARAVFGLTDAVSEAWLFVRDGYEAAVAEAAERLNRAPGAPLGGLLAAETRAVRARAVARSHDLRGGHFAALFAVALALAVPAFGALSYQGVAPRRHAIGLMKTTGWSTADVLELVALENLVIGVGAAALGLALAWCWTRLLGAPLLAWLFVPDLEVFPAQRLPARFTPLPPVIALVAALAVTLPGSLWTTWRTARAMPSEVLH